MTAEQPEEGPRRPGRWRTGERSRRRILDAARSCFAERGYDRATVRQIATDAQVDPAMVYYFFESKSRLFTAALAMPVNPAERLADALAPGLDGAGERIVRHFLGVWDSAASIEPLLALMRSAPTDERSAAMFTEYLQREVVGRLAAVVPADDAHLRAELLGSHLMGIALARYITRLEPLASASVDVLAAWVGPTLQRYLAGPSPTA